MYLWKLLNHNKITWPRTWVEQSHVTQNARLKFDGPITNRSFTTSFFSSREDLNFKVMAIVCYFGSYDVKWSPDCLAPQAYTLAIITEPLSNCLAPQGYTVFLIERSRPRIPIFTKVWRHACDLENDDIIGQNENSTFQPRTDSDQSEIEKKSWSWGYGWCLRYVIPIYVLI